MRFQSYRAQDSVRGDKSLGKKDWRNKIRNLLAKESGVGSHRNDSA